MGKPLFERPPPPQAINNATTKAARMSFGTWAAFIFNFLRVRVRIQALGIGLRLMNFKNQDTQSILGVVRNDT